MLGREGVDEQTVGMFYVAVVQAVLLYGLLKWVMYLYIGRKLSSIQHSESFRTKGRQPKREQDGARVYPQLEEEMLEVVLKEVDSYVAHHQNTVTQYIYTRPIMDLCMAAEQ